MFWKKSNNKEGNSNKLYSTPSDARKGFRVTPSLNAPLMATLNKTSIFILNISSVGLCCKKNDLEVGKTFIAEVVLPPENKQISVSAEILENSDENNCRCLFLDLSPDFEDAIHLYVLNRQKEDQENRNKNPS